MINFQINSNDQNHVSRVIPICRDLAEGARACSRMLVPILLRFAGFFTSVQNDPERKVIFFFLSDHPERAARRSEGPPSVGAGNNQNPNDLNSKPSLGVILRSWGDEGSSEAQRI